MPAGNSARFEASQLRKRAAKLSADADKWDAGAVGEERVAAAIDSMDRSGTRVLHDRLLRPRSKANIDHLFVSGGGVFLIDAKNWSGQITVHDESLWQQTATRGDRGFKRDDELAKISSAAAEIQADTSHHVTAVLCLAADGSERFGEPQEVRGVHVVPLRSLVAWLENRPPATSPINVGTVAVDLSFRYPEATGDALTLAGLAKESPAPMPPPPRAGHRPERRNTRRPVVRGARPAGITRVVAFVVLALVLVSIAPRLIQSFSTSATNAVAQLGASTRPSTPSGSPITLSVKQRQELADWSIRASLYQAHEKPATLPYVQPANLGMESDSCAAQMDALAPFRRGLFQAPDKSLVALAKRYDVATHELLTACKRNQPVALSHAQGRMDALASAINVRYNRLLGVDPSSYAAKRVL